MSSMYLFITQGKKNILQVGWMDEYLLFTQSFYLYIHVADLNFTVLPATSMQSQLRNACLCHGGSAQQYQRKC